MEEEEEEDHCYPLNSSRRGHPARPLSETVVLYVLFFSVSMLIVALNLLVIVSISHFRQLHTPTNLLLLSLAVSDSLVGLLLMPVETVQLLNRCWARGHLMCFLSFIIGFTLTSASMGSMVLISVDRFVAICYPLQYRNKITRGRTEASVCLCWLCSILYNVLIIKEHNVPADQPLSFNRECSIEMDQATSTADLVLTFIFPCAVIFILYTRVFIVAVSQARVMNTVVSVRVTAKKSEKKAARTVGIVTSVFLVSFCPYYTYVASGQDTSLTSPSHITVSFLMFFTSGLNPLIYAIFYPWFRKAIRLIVTLKILEQDSSCANII